ncbi:hypothetical protein ACFFQW_35115 [Umezawaea endophytica]|uniref:FAD binding domain-containing protein n=1 Tax=Umezawaea endophytica TaxID=1654476 RepID=A0A9X2VXW2_9PSEU|nr:hypothetical protein [Umezawaea endophytica]MCS7483728.1 hypothetical protein [Umezawaea endophytica]
MLELSHEAVMWNAPGKAAALYAAGDDDEVHAFLNCALPRPPFREFPGRHRAPDLLTMVFADAGWRIPDMLTAMQHTNDLFFGTASQIRMPRWSARRVALAGDAAHAPSFLTGQGASIALVGVYLLAGALAGPSHVEGFAAYEARTREFVTLHQELAGHVCPTLFPVTAGDLNQRDDRLRRLIVLPPRLGRPDACSIVGDHSSASSRWPSLP